MIHVIVLAAGQGLRLGRLTEDTPKFLLSYKGVPIFARLLENVKLLKQYFVLVVLGAKGKCWNQKYTDLYNSIVRKKGASLNISNVVNYDNDVTNNSYSLRLALQNNISALDSVLIIDGDIVFKNINFMKKVINQKDCIVIKENNDLPSVKLDSNGFINGMSRDYKTGLQNSGIIKLSKETALKLYKILQDEKYKYKEIIYPLNELFKTVKIKALINNDTININTFSDITECKEKKCFLNDIYYTNSDESVKLRIKLGQKLFKQDKHYYDYDCVIPVMESGLHFASGFSLESKIPMIIGIDRIVGVGRTLYRDNREILFDKKYIIYPGLFNDKRVVLVDEAIFSGKTLNYLVDKIKAVSNPKELHIRIITPPIMKDCEILPDTIIKCYEEIASKVDSIRFMENDIFKRTMRGYCMECLK